MKEKKMGPNDEYHLDVTRFTNPGDSIKAVWRFKQEVPPTVPKSADEREFLEWVEACRDLEARFDDWWTVDPATNGVTLRPPKRCRCKTRKRFVKLLMADGISRNEANALAKLFQYLFSKVGPDEPNGYQRICANYSIVKPKAR